MKDIQNQVDHRRINIKKVGVKTITYPITVLDKSQHQQKTIATVNMYVNLPHQFKGTHMSRFVEILNRFHGRIDVKGFRLILEEMKKKLDAEAAHIEMSFPFFLYDSDNKRTFQVRKYECTMLCSLEDEEDIRLDIVVPVADSLCTEQKTEKRREEESAKNVLIKVRFMKFMWLEDLIDIVESAVKQEAAASRNNRVPMESLLGNLANKFTGLDELKWYSITIENGSQGYSLYTSLSTDDTKRYH